MTLALAAYAGFIAYSSASFLPDDEDGVNFILGVKDYNPVFHQPHFPGYPVYVALGKIIALWAPSPELALGLVSIIASALSVWVVSCIARSETGAWGGIAASALLAGTGIFTSYSGKIFSEPLALLVLLLWMAALKNCKPRPRDWFLSGLSAGLLLGVRLSWWPFTVAGVYYAYRNSGIKNHLAGICSGILVWLPVMVFVIGPTQLADTAFDFVYGHFFDWGGAITSTNGSSHRFYDWRMNLAQALGVIGFEGFRLINAVWIILLAASSYYWIRGNEKVAVAIKMLIAGAALYAIWIMAGQNVSKTRHFLPFAPVAVILTLPLFNRWPKAFTALALILLLGGNVLRHDPVIKTPPVFNMAQWLEGAENGSALFCGPAERYFDLYPAKIPVISVKHGDSLRGIIKSRWPEPSAILVCDDIPGVKLTGAPEAVFAARPGDPVDRTLKIYKLAPDEI